MESGIKHFPHVITGGNRCTVYGVLKTKVIGNGPCVNPGHEVPYVMRVNGDLVDSFFKVFVFCFMKERVEFRTFFVSEMDCLVKSMLFIITTVYGYVTVHELRGISYMRGKVVVDVLMLPGRCGVCKRDRKIFLGPSQILGPPGFGLG